MGATTLAESILLNTSFSSKQYENNVALQVGLTNPEAPVFEGDERLKPITYGHLHRALLDLTGVIRSNGVLSPGDTAAIVIPNSVDFVGAFLATCLARAVAAPLNFKYKKDELIFYLTDQKAKAVILPTIGANTAAIEAASQLGIPVYRIKAINDPEWGGVAFTLFDETRGTFLKEAKGLSRACSTNQLKLKDPPKPSDVALLLHTSGTTSRPKGVPLTHSNICASISNIRKTYEFSPEDRSLLVMPLFHVHGLMCGLLTQMASRSQVVIPWGGSFSAHMFWQDARHFRITWYTAVPTIHQVLLLRADKDYPARDPPPLRLIRSSSSSLAPSVLEKLEKTFRAPVVEAYAMTEACHQMTSNPLPKYGKRLPGSVGVGMGVQVAILDESLRLLPPKSIGEVCIRGPNVTQGYLNNPKATKEAFAGGWFHTGDQGWLDEKGYLTLTGRLKELINRGGEKISPLEIDSALISHPFLAEAVAFGFPDEKYGEVVHAAVVLKDKSHTKVTQRELQEHCKSKLADFKIPIQFHFLDTMPKTATGKVQRRMVREFVSKNQDRMTRQKETDQDKTRRASSSSPMKGFDLIAKCLSKLGVKHMIGIVGIPVTQLATAAQSEGIRYVGFRNEQAAGYAASCMGFLTGEPSVLLTVSGPGVVHGLAGLSNATANCWPMIMISGSVEQKLVGKGGFQELDQCAVATPHCKAVYQISKISQVGSVLSTALHEAMSGRPGGVYVDVPADVLFSHVQSTKDEKILRGVRYISQDFFRFTADESRVSKAATMLLKARRPLVIVGKGAAYSRVEAELENFVNLTSMPCLASPMGKGLLPDSHLLSMGPARSKAMKESDVVLVLGTRLNWQWEFGKSPKWASNAKFIIVDSLQPRKRSQHSLRVGSIYLHGDAKNVLGQLTNSLYRKSYSKQRIEKWTNALILEKEGKVATLTKQLSCYTNPMSYHTVFGILSKAMNGCTTTQRPILVNEGANTMDIGRIALPIEEPRTRLDAGTWGTMGVGLGYGIAAALVNPDRPVLLVLGDSAFGFSGMECEVIMRYHLKVIVVVLNNGGIYGGDRRPQGEKERARKGLRGVGYGHDPPPTAFGATSQYELLMKAFGGRGSSCQSPEELQVEIERALQEVKPCLLNVRIDPKSGVESARIGFLNSKL